MKTMQRQMCQVFVTRGVSYYIYKINYNIVNVISPTQIIRDGEIQSKHLEYLQPKFGRQVCPEGQGFVIT